MSMLTDDSAVMSKTRELCGAIASDDRFASLQKDVERFLEDDAARTMYQSVHERGGQLQQKQQAGMELSPSEIREFEAAREALLENEVAKAFLDAQGELETLQQAIGKYVGMTLETGRVPSADDLAAASGCCGGSSGNGGGCGCG